MVGTLVISVVPFIYIFSDHINFIYVAQIIEVIRSGMAFPSWMAIWARNADINNRSFEWSIYSTLTGIGTGAAALIGATIA